VVHVVRAANGLQAVCDFGQAIRQHDPGVDYELVLAMKGFRSPADATEHVRELADLEPRTLHFPDVGYDLGVFLGASARLRRAHYCFMNSWARPVSDGWLAKLGGVLERPDVGMVGATGSWGSMRSWLTYALGLPSAYRAILPPRRQGLMQLQQTEVQLRGDVPGEAYGKLLRRLTLLRQTPELLLDFEPFPSPHLRTAAFMISHELLVRLKLFAVTNNRVDAYALESGRRSLTRQVEQLGLLVAVVDSGGSVYGPREWDRSDTYHSGDQHRLLIADRRTDEFDRANIAQRRLMAALSWGATGV
jgi:hypothetical protein